MTIVLFHLIQVIQLRINSIPVTGINGTLLGIDTRPANDLVYSITTNNEIYTLDLDGFSSGDFNGNFTLTDDEESELLSNALYVNLHTQNFNGGELRGQVNVEVENDLVVSDLVMEESQQVGDVIPPDTAATASFDVVYDDTTNRLIINGSYSQLTSSLFSVGPDLDAEGNPQSPIHIHNGVAGANGPIVRNLTVFEDSSSFAGDFVLTDEEETLLLDDALYVNLHTQNFNGGELRGQVNVEVENDVVVYGLAIEESQEVGETTPPDTPANGSFNLVYDTSNNNLTVTGGFSELTSPLLFVGDTDSEGNPQSPIHIHNGVAGANGPIIRNLTTSDDVATFVSTLNTPFLATNISGFDFNPVADRLRLVGGNDQDFRINVDTGEVTVDGDLAYAQGDINFGANPNVTAAAYTNAIANPTSTELYDIDADLDILVLQNPPNDGTLMTIGALGIDVDTLAGFDIVSSEDQQINTAFAVANSTLYNIDLSTGTATSLGQIGSDTDDFTLQGLAALDSPPTVPPVAVNSQFIGLSNGNQLVSFSASNSAQSTTMDIVGLDGSLLGIDTRPSNGLIYGITTNNTIYTINANTGIARKVSTLNIPFTDASISGFDFNPVADRLRLVGGNNQDFRINVETGEVTVDGDLAFAVGDVNEGVDPTVTAAAYTNAIANPTSTQLYDIDADLDVLVLQNPPNDGTLMTIGSLGIDVDTLAGFDIISSDDEEQNAAFAVANSILYSVDLNTGRATNIGSIGSDTDNFNIQGLATVDRSSLVNSIATNSRFLALSSNNTLDSFDPRNPQAVRQINIQNLGDSEILIGIDTRPANGLVYGITDADKIYTIDPNTGMATLISTLNESFNATTVSGFDFNPVADRLRLVGDNEQDFRINVDTGEVTVDGDLAYAQGDINSGADPTVTAAAYTNAIANPTSTELYDIDAELDILVLQNPPNDGTLMTIGELGIDFDLLGGFDIISSGEGSNSAFAISNSTLYSIDLLTGMASSLGAIGSGNANNYQGLATVSNSVINTTTISFNADETGLTDFLVYDITGTNQVNVNLNNNPATESDASFDNFVGLYEVTDSSGGIDLNGDGRADLLPTDPGYASSAISRRVDNFAIRTGGDMSDNTTNENFSPVLVSGGKFYAPFIIANLGNNTVEDFLGANPGNEAAEFFEDQVAYFSFIGANPDGANHLQSRGNNIFGFEDLPSNLGVSDNDFNDAVFQLDFRGFA